MPSMYSYAWTLSTRYVNIWMHWAYSRTSHMAYCIIFVCVLSFHSTNNRLVFICRINRRLQHSNIATEVQQTAQRQCIIISIFIAPEWNDTLRVYCLCLHKMHFILLLMILVRWMQRLMVSTFCGRACSISIFWWRSLFRIKTVQNDDVVYILNLWLECVCLWRISRTGFSNQRPIDAKRTLKHKRFEYLEHFSCSAIYGCIRFADSQCFDQYSMFQNPIKTNGFEWHQL